MGGSSRSTNENQTKTQMANTKQLNPYYQTVTNSQGITKSKFTPGSAGETTYNFVNKNIENLLNNYLNPSLDSTINQAKLNSFNKVQQQNLQNNIINPLTQNKMLRSSQATNLYNNLSNQSADYANQLIADSQNDTWNIINNLMSLYMNGYQGINSEQGQNINSAIGTGTTSTNTMNARRSAGY